MPGRRLVWFSVGVATGAAGTVYGYVRAREATRVRADDVAEAVVAAARSVGSGVVALVEDSRHAIREAEEELRASMEQRRSAVRSAPVALVPGPDESDRRQRRGRRSVG